MSKNKFCAITLCKIRDMDYPIDRILDGCVKFKHKVPLLVCCAKQHCL